MQVDTATKKVTLTGLVALEVIGRKSGRKITFPLVMVTVERERYLASMLGENVQYIRNVWASGGKAILCSVVEKMSVSNRFLLQNGRLY
jgi:hypothetical protein